MNSFRKQRTLAMMTGFERYTKKTWQCSWKRWKRWKRWRGRAVGGIVCADRAALSQAHHVTVEGGKRSLMIAALRYSDQFVKIDGTWLFAERLLYVDWLEERALS